jgi:hypothetical protein
VLSSRVVRCFLVLCVGLGPGTPPPLRTPTRSQANGAPAADTLFAFKSNFWVNLHHFLYLLARAHRGAGDSANPAVLDAPGDTAGLGSLTTKERAGWARALAYYDTALAGRDISFDSTIVDVNYALSGMESTTILLPNPGIQPGLAAALAAAAPAYRRAWWPRHDRANRAWTASMQPLLHESGDTIARQLEKIYRVPWPRREAPVQVVAYAKWGGAYTTLYPPLITMGSLYAGHRGTLGLEQIFHEASHSMMDSVNAALRAAGVEPWGDQGRNAAHAIIFYTAGEVVRRVAPTHTPYAEWRHLWTETSLRQYRTALTKDWERYLDGKGTLRDAVAAIAQSR